MSLVYTMLPQAYSKDKQVEVRSHIPTQLLTPCSTFHSICKDWQSWPQILNLSYLSAFYCRRLIGAAQSERGGSVWKPQFRAKQSFSQLVFLKVITQMLLSASPSPMHFRYPSEVLVFYLCSSWVDVYLIYTDWSVGLISIWGKRLRIHYEIYIRFSPDVDIY